MCHKILRFCLFILISLQLISCERSPHTFQGYIEGDYIYLSSPFAGELIKLAVHRGQKVVAQQNIFILDQEPQQAQYKQTAENLKQAEKTLADMSKGQRQEIIDSIKAQIAQAQADINLTTQRVARYQKLLVRGAVDKDTYDAAVSNHDRAIKLKAQYDANLANAKLSSSREDALKAQQAVVKATQAQLEQAKWNLDQKSLNAPTAGLIYDTYFREGEFVPANQAVASLLAPANIRVVFFIPETILSKIALNQSVQITCDGCNKNFSGKITYISPQAEYTPPVIFSRDNNYNLMYRIYAYPDHAEFFHPGQPVYVALGEDKNAK